MWTWCYILCCININNINNLFHPILLCVDIIGGNKSRSRMQNNDAKCDATAISFNAAIIIPEFCLDLMHMPWKYILVQSLIVKLVFVVIYLQDCQMQRYLPIIRIEIMKTNKVLDQATIKLLRCQLMRQLATASQCRSYH